MVTRGQMRLAEYRDLVWLRYVADAELDAVEARVDSHANGFMTLSLPSGEWVEITYGPLPGFPDKSDSEPAVTACGQFVVESIEFGSPVARQAAEYEAQIQKDEQAWARALALTSPVDAFAGGVQ